MMRERVLTLEQYISKTDLVSLELFSDGYQKLPGGTLVSDWERMFFAVEQDDPSRLGIVPAVKGSTEEVWFDDRTVLSCVRTMPRIMSVSASR